MLFLASSSILRTAKFHTPVRLFIQVMSADSWFLVSRSFNWRWIISKALLGCDVTLDHLLGHLTCRRSEVGSGPQRRKFLEGGVLDSQLMGSEALALLDHLRRRISWPHLDKQVDMIWLNSKLKDVPPMLGALLFDERFAVLGDLAYKHRLPPLRYPDQVVDNQVNPVLVSFISRIFHVVNMHTNNIIVNRAANAPQETRLTTAAKVAWISSGSKIFHGASLPLIPGHCPLPSGWRNGSSRSGSGADWCGCCPPPPRRHRHRAGPAPSCAPVARCWAWSRAG